MNRTLMVLTAAASVAQTGAPIVVLLGRCGATMAPVPGLATLPVALMIVGTAMSTIPASLLMRRVGQGWFIFAAVIPPVAGTRCTCHHQRLVLDAVCRHIFDW